MERNNILKKTKVISKNIIETMKLLLRYEKKYIFLSLFLNISVSTLPFISIIISQKMLNMLQIGGEKSTLIKVLILYTTIKMVSLILNNFNSYYLTKYSDYLFYHLNVLFLDKTKQLQVTPAAVLLGLHYKKDTRYKRGHKSQQKRKTCGARLAPFDIPQLREVMAYDELELDRIGDRKTAVFFIISDTTQTYNFLVALAFSQMFNLLCERADNVHGGRLPHHVRVLWDEAANTGQVPQLEKLVAVIRSREVSLCLLYQQLAQCKAIYDKHAETILGNMDSVVFLGGREASTIKEISENWLGKATISMQTDSRSRGQSESYSQNTQRLGRELMTPAELATMPGDKCILQLRGLPPFFSPKYDLKRHPNYRYTAEADKQKNAFDLDRLINRRRRPGLNEACTMYEVTVPDDALTEEDEDILNYDDIDDPDAFA